MKSFLRVEFSLAEENDISVIWRRILNLLIDKFSSWHENVRECKNVKMFVVQVLCEENITLQPCSYHVLGSCGTVLINTLYIRVQIYSVK